MFTNRVKIRILIANLLILIGIIFVQGVTEKNRLFSLYYSGLLIALLVNIYLITISLKSKKLSLGFLFIILTNMFSFVDFYLFDYMFLKQSIYLNIYRATLFLGLCFIIIGAITVLYNYITLNKQLEKIAYYDALTNLPNRNYLLSNYKDINTQMALLYIDVDDFKFINDYCGHIGGDEVLKLIANRLQQVVDKDDIVCRISGDEFVIISENRSCINTKSIIPFLNKIQDIAGQPATINEKNMKISISVGVAVYPENGDCLDEILKKADIALYFAKRQGKNRYVIFNDDLWENFNNHYKKVYEIKSAIENKEFIIHYQPKACIETNKITGLEALVRWNHPTKGIIYPDAFISCAEETGLISQIDITVLEIAAQQLSEWNKQGKKKYNISINISPQFFLSTHFIPTVDRVLKKYVVNPSNLQLEITENIALNDINLSKEVIKELRVRNIKISIDDFGKGYSSMTYIKEFYFNDLKIDKSFIDNIINNKVDQTMIEMIINLSKIRGFEVVAEGVETDEQLAFLRKLGCHKYQGYLLSKPKPIHELCI
ncbi:putative bifunctional diguanylate cyclase/phosphodiesterase [Haloplasma contractile]|uniref:Sensory box-GGDEF family protein n=1 Tax=Haloplasma contractile SSD-17B TaxID=1033810 RepID=U2EE26_9MOLU|nr:bifunctional diguanylate cyclase/phosphodiesterase [Haloplasma contractile]ERJ13243.1 Sensory box-GGDEF family protein [Haloplasma contractile SSD-17B]